MKFPEFKNQLDLNDNDEIINFEQEYKGLNPLLYYIDYHIDKNNINLKKLSYLIDNCDVNKKNGVNWTPLISLIITHDFSDFNILKKLFLKTNLENLNTEFINIFLKKNILNKEELVTLINHKKTLTANEFISILKNKDFLKLNLEDFLPIYSSLKNKEQVYSALFLNTTELHFLDKIIALHQSFEEKKIIESKIIINNKNKNLKQNKL